MLRPISTKSMYTATSTLLGMSGLCTLHYPFPSQKGLGANSTNPIYQSTYIELCEVNHLVMSYPWKKMRIWGYHTRRDHYYHIHRDLRSPKTPLLPSPLASSSRHTVSCRPPLGPVPATSLLVMITPHNLYYRKLIEHD